MHEITKKIKEYMKERDLNQQEMGKLIGVSKSHMSKIMNGHQDPGSRMVDKYYKLPGIKEREAIEEAKQVIDDLWLSGQIDEPAAKELVRALQYDSDN